MLGIAVDSITNTVDGSGLLNVRIHACSSKAESWVDIPGTTSDIQIDGVALEDANEGLDPSLPESRLIIQANLFTAVLAVVVTMPMYSYDNLIGRQSKDDDALEDATTYNSYFEYPIGPSEYDPAP